MEDSQKLPLFHESGIYHFNDSNTVFIDPVRVLNRSYNRFTISPSTYYPRFFESRTLTPKNPISTTVSSSPTKRKLKKRKRSSKDSRPLNDREQIALQRHQELRPLLLKAHECLLKSNGLLDALRSLRSENVSHCLKEECEGSEQCFVELGQQSPDLVVTLNLRIRDSDKDLEDSPNVYCEQRSILPAFNNLVANDTEDDAVADILNNHYIMPRESCFYMSDLGQIRNLIPAHTDCGFNLIMVDPPWENASAHQKSRYPTLPNRYFLSLPIKQLTHTEGALVALWVTNREKLRSFVEKELFAAWGVSYAASFHWLKVKANGSLISDLDLFHHRPYESLILGYSPGKVKNSDNQTKFKPLKDDHVIMSIPGDYSRKPPIADLLQEYIPGVKPPRCVELFAREVMAGWVAWGNEPLHFQDSRYFVKKMDS
ncbi:methyltransferase-like protein 2 [Trifolium pratense]|uniref:methyltransferase-like protein 2 n=1 Tax=Trifolium pratense TaxID=57577 RepID=UPI001E6968F6|nr:methyltransferase-like protein 2 [Trifolium pratense]XP_045791491.1 methyltransferase-like protein 2 [Trifolium pratense]